MPDEKVEPQRARIVWTPLVWRDHEYPFYEDLVTDDAGVVDSQLPTVADVLSLLEVGARGGVVDTVLPNHQLREH